MLSISLKNSANYFNSRGSTVNLGFIDVRKAFDKASHWGILNLLHNKNVNPAIIAIIDHWFAIGSAKVSWNSCLSDPVTLTAGVRQDGVLSPLFSAYLDPLLDELGKPNLY